MSESDFSAINEARQPRVLDLFCGGGGFSLGVENAGYDVIAGVDINDAAMQTYEENHDSRAIQQDLTAMSPAQFADEYDIPPTEVDGVIGGSPCQGFSPANIHRSLEDERCNLVFVFAEYVAYYEPDVFVMENVKGIQTGEREKLFERLLDDFCEAGYVVDWRVLNAADYGVPQTRERVFVSGVLDGNVGWPERTHAPATEIEMEVGGGGVAVPDDFKPYITVGDALGDDAATDGLNDKVPNIQEKTVKRIEATDEGEQLYDSYETNKRLAANEPAPTIIGKDWKYAHYDEPRPLTVRERERNYSRFQTSTNFVGVERSVDSKLLTQYHHDWQSN